MLKKVLYFAMVICALAIYSLQQFHYSLPLVINNYVNDFLCLPLVLGAIVYLIRIIKKDKFFQLPIYIILLLAFFYSVFFEYYLPKVNLRYTGDWIDVILYLLGGVCFYYFDKGK